MIFADGAACSPLGAVQCIDRHVDLPDLDFALPGDAVGLDDGAHDIAAQASAAWETAAWLGRRVRGPASSPKFQRSENAFQEWGLLATALTFASNRAWCAQRPGERIG
jgi:hypothetical protein